MGEIQKTASLKLNRALRKWTLTRRTQVVCVAHLTALEMLMTRTTRTVQLSTKPTITDLTWMHYLSSKQL